MPPTLRKRAPAAPLSPPLSSPPRTPSTRARSKKARVIHPTPASDADSDSGDNYPLPSHLQSTGLTPAASRITLTPANHPPSTASRRSRKNGYRAKGALTPSSNEYIFLPFNDVLDSRTMRRIRRYGYSEEINRITSAKQQRQKETKRREEELRALRDEVEQLRRSKEREEAHLTPPADNESDAWRRIRELEALLRESGSGKGGTESGLPSPPDMDNDDTLVEEDEESDDDGGNGFEPFDMPSSPSKSHAHQSTPPLDMNNSHDELPHFNLRSELDQLREEKRALFQQWKKRCLPYTEDSNSAPTNSPDNNDDKNENENVQEIITTFTHLVASRAKAMATLDQIHQSLTTTGFAGPDTPQIITAISQSFADARSKLLDDSCAPDWRSVLSALVQRINALASDLEESRSRTTAAEESHADTAARLAHAQRITHDLEAAHASMAASTRALLARVRALEDQRASDARRLGMADERYRRQIRVLQDMNAALEAQSVAAVERVERMERAGERIARVADVAQGKVRMLEGRVRGEEEARGVLERELEGRVAEVEALEEGVRELRREKEGVVAELRRRVNEEAEGREREVGLLNIRVAGLATQVDEAETRCAEMVRQRDEMREELEALRERFDPESIEALHVMTQAVARQVEVWQREAGQTKKSCWT